MTPPENTSEVLLGRQPILDGAQRLYGFELLFRQSRRVNQAIVDCDVAATARVITQTFGDFGVESVLGNTKGFINVDQTLLMSESVEFLPRKNVVLEILETTTPTPPVLKRCKELVTKGFTLALDDVTGENTTYRKFLPYVKIVKVEIKDQPWKRIQKVVDHLLPTGKILLAEKVDKKKQVEICKKMGFNLFQGYYFATPTIITGKRIGHSDFSLLQLLNLLSNDADTRELESVLKHEPGLSLRLMRTVNSAGMGLMSEIDSIRQAVTILGRHQLRRWVQLLFYAKLGGGNSPLLQLATSRGRLMELATAKFKNTSKAFQEKAFMVGIFSLLNVLLNVPMTDILDSLNISASIRDALENRGGPLGRLLLWVEALERQDEHIVIPLELKHMSNEEVAMMIVDSFRWTAQWVTNVEKPVPAH